MSYKRYAIFFTPAGPWATFMSAWLGWDTGSGVTPTAPDNPPHGWPMITKRPRPYGVHATLKAPFALAGGTDAAALSKKLAAFAAKTPVVTAGDLQINRIGSFLALTLTGDQTAINDLAAKVVQEFDGYRAPLTDAARAKRKGLNPHQKELMEQWGYPYVLDAFRFHITLTGPLSADQTKPITDYLQTSLAPLLPKPLVIETLSLMGEDADGMFHQLDQFELKG